MTKPSAAWYVVPIILGIIGSIIMWYILKDENDSAKMIRKGWIIGIIITIVGSLGGIFPHLLII